jgi:hypothetical protein
MEAFPMMTPAQLDDVYGTLIDADAGGDAETLARISWQLYGELGVTRARAETLRARLTLIARAVRPDGPPPGAAGSGGGTAHAGQRCPGCGTPGQADGCVFCGQPQDPACGHGLDYTPASADAPGRWRCTGCGAVAADDSRQPAGARS